MAGPEPMYVMMDGKMMKLTPLAKDVKLKNGCTVCTNGAVIDPKGKKTMVKNGQAVSADGAVATWLDRPKP